MALKDNLRDAIRRVNQDQIDELSKPKTDTQGAIRGPGGDVPTAPPPPLVEPQRSPGERPPTTPTLNPTISREALMNAGLLPGPENLPERPRGPTTDETARKVAEQLRTAKDSPLYVPEDRIEVEFGGEPQVSPGQPTPEAEIQRRIEAVDALEPETPQEERAFKLFEMMQIPEPERSQREKDLIGLYANEFVDEDGLIVFPDKIQQIFDVATQVNTFVAQQERDINRFMVTTVTNALDAAYQSAVEEDGGIRFDSILQSQTFRELNNALGALLGGGTLEPITILDEKGLPILADLNTAEGLSTAMSSLSRIVAEAGNRQVRADAANVEVFNMVDQWSTKTDNVLLQTGNPTKFGNFLSVAMFRARHSDARVATEPVGAAPIHVIANSRYYQEAGSIVELWNRREEFAITFNETKGMRVTQRTSPEDVHKALIASQFENIERYARDNGIPIETALAWMQWTIDNEITPEDATLVENMLTRNGVGRRTDNVIDDLIRGYLELPDIFQKHLMDGLVWLDDQTGPLELGTNIYRGVSVLGNAPVEPFRTAINLVEGDYDEAFTGFIDRHKATGAYMEAYGALGDEQREELIRSGFGALWAGYAGADDINRVVNDLNANLTIQEVLERNADTWSAISQVLDELIFDPANGPLVITGGVGVYMKLAGGLAKGTRVAGVSASVASRSARAARLIETGGGAALAAGRGAQRGARITSQLDPLNLLGDQLIKLAVAPAFVGSIKYGGRAGLSIAHLVTDSPLMQSVIQAGARRKEIDLLETVGNQFRWAYRPAHEITGTARGVFSEQLPQVFRSYGRTVNNITVQNAKFRATRRALSGRLAKIAQFEVADHLRTVYPNGNFLKGSAGRAAADYVHRLNNLYLDMFGSTDQLGAEALQGLFRSRRNEIREVISGLIPGRTNLNEALMWIAESTKNVDLFKDPRIAAQTKRLVGFDDLDEIKNLKDPIARAAKFQEVKNEWNQALHRIIREESQAAMGITKFSIPEHLVSAMSTPLSYLFLATPRFLIRNAVGGHILAALYRAAPAFGEDGLFSLRNITGRRARSFLDANGVPDIAAVDFFGTTTARVTGENTRRLNTLRSILDFRAHDRRLDQILRTKVFAHQYRKQRDAFRQAILRGTEDHQGFRDALIDAFKGNESAADNILAQFDDMDKLDEIIEHMNELRQMFVNEQEYVRATPSALLGDIPMPPELKGDIHSRLAARLRAIDPTDGEQIGRVLDAEIDSIVDDIQTAIKEGEFEDVINLSPDDLTGMAQQWVRDVEMLSTIPGVSRDELMDWMGSPNVNLFNRLAHWATDVQEQDTMELIRATIGDEKLREIFEESYRAYRSQDLVLLRHQKYGIPGKVDAPDEFRAFMYLPEGADKPAAFANIPDEWITRNALEEQDTYLAWVRREKFSGEGYEVVGGGLANITDDTAANYYRQLRELAANRADDGVPRPFGIQAERVRLSYIRKTTGGLTPRQLSEYYRYITDLETHYTTARNVKFNERILTPLRQALQDDNVPVELLPPRASAASGSGSNLEHILPLEKVDGAAVRTVLDTQEAAVREIAESARKAAAESARALGKGTKPRVKTNMRNIEKQWKVLTGSRENLQRADAAQIILDRMSREAPIEHMPPVPEVVALAGDEIRRLGYLQMMKNNVGTFLEQRQRSMSLIRPGKQRIVPKGNPADYVYHGSSDDFLASITSTGLQPRSEERGVEGLLLWVAPTEEEARDFAIERSLVTAGKGEKFTEAAREKGVLFRIRREFFEEGDLLTIDQAGIERVGVNTNMVTRRAIPPEAIEVFDKDLGAWKTLLPAMDVDSTAFDLTDFLGGVAGDRRLYFVPDATEDALKKQLTDANSRRMLELGGRHVTNNPEIPSRVAGRFRPRPIKASMPQSLKDALEIWDLHFSDLDLDDIISRIPSDIATRQPRQLFDFPPQIIPSDDPVLALLRREHPSELLGTYGDAESVVAILRGDKDRLVRDLSQAHASALRKTDIADEDFAREVDRFRTEISEIITPETLKKAGDEIERITAEAMRIRGARTEPIRIFRGGEIAGRNLPITRTTSDRKIAEMFQSDVKLKTREPRRQAAQRPGVREILVEPDRVMADVPAILGPNFKFFDEQELLMLAEDVRPFRPVPTEGVAQGFMENVEEARRKIMEIPTVGEHVEANFAAYMDGRAPTEITNFRQAERYTLALEEVMDLFQELQDEKTLKAVLTGLQQPSRSRLGAGTVQLNNPVRGPGAVDVNFLDNAERHFMRLGGSQTKVRNALDDIRNRIAAGEAVSIQDVVARLVTATDGTTVRNFLSSLGHDGIAFRGVDAMGQLTDNLVVFDEALINPRLAAADSLPPVQRTFTPDELTDIDQVLTNTEQQFRMAEEHAQAGAMEVTNWATHNAFHSTDMDFLARFFYPWEWWMTRTLGKGVLRLAERPYLATGYARMYNELNEINGDLPSWMRDRVRVGIPGWPDFLGAGPFFDPTSLIFQFQLEPFEEPGRGPLGDALAWMSGVGLGFNPFLDTALSLTGQMGQFSKETPFPTTGIEQWYNAVQNILTERGINTGLPSRIRWTERERFVLERSLWRLVIQDVETGADEYTREEIQEALLIIRGELETDNPLGAIFESDLQRTDNVLVQHALNWMRQEELLSQNLSFFTGILSSARSPLDQVFFDRIDELREDLNQAILISKGTIGLDGDGGRALRNFFETNPDAEFLFLRSDATEDLIRSQALNEYYSGIENFFAPVNSRLDALPLQGEEARIERRRILADIFDQGPNGEPSKFEQEQERLLADNGLTPNDVGRDPDFQSTPHSRDLLISWQDFEFRGDFEGQREWFNSLSPEDQEILENEKRNLSTNIGEHIAVSLDRIVDNCSELFRDTNGIVDWGACFRKRDQILDALPPEVKAEVLYAQHQFDSPRELVREVVNNYYIENWLEYINVGRNLDRDERLAQQTAFANRFNPPSQDEIVNRIREIAPWVSRAELLDAYNPDEFLNFPAFVALQDNRNIVDLENFEEPFEAPSGEIVSPKNFEDYLTALDERDDYLSDRDAEVPSPWTERLEFFFGNGAEGVDLMRRQDTVRDWFSRLIAFADGKDGDRELGSFARTIPALDESMTIDEAFDVLSSIRDRLDFMREAQFNPWTVVTPGGGSRLLKPEELEKLSQGNPIPGVPTGFIVRQTDNGLQSFSDFETAREQEEAEARLNSLRNARGGTASRSGTQLSKTDILRLLGEGRLKAQDAFERLLRLGYNQQDARLLVESEIDEDEGPTIRRAGQAGEPSADGLRRRAREILGSDRVIEELVDVITLGRTLSNQGEKDLRLLKRLYPIPGAHDFDSWLKAVEVLLAASRRGITVTRRGSNPVRRQEIRRVRPLR